MKVSEEEITGEKSYGRNEESVGKMNGVRGNIRICEE